MQLPKYLSKGFTITQWIRFKDRVNSGTIFNFGNPTRAINPMGFRLETLVVKKSNFDGTHPSEFFEDNEYERFVRLVVREGDDKLRDSNIGTLNYAKYDTATSATTAYDANKFYVFNYTKIPMDFDEWYFVVATYNPFVKEDDSLGSYSQYNNDSDFWMNNKDTGGSFTNFSGYGNKCKVEIISKSDLLRARGYKI
mgnify:CR=1 FL=1|tara:strand:+ start:1387 stop:1974 length:588 start_codon:yes stop_codon:yes gene_type:complete